MGKSVDFETYQPDRLQHNLELNCIAEQNWVSLNKNLQFVPPNAVIAGTHSNGSLVYVGRTSYRNEILTVKYIPDLKKAYIPFWVREREVKDIEVLCENDIRCRWVQGKPGSIPENAVMTGKVGKHEPIYVGRQAIDGHYTPGKIIKSKTLYLPYAGKEQKFKEFEVLVAEKKRKYRCYRKWQCLKVLPQFQPIGSLPTPSSGRNMPSLRVMMPMDP